MKSRLTIILSMEFVQILVTNLWPASLSSLMITALISLSKVAFFSWEMHGGQASELVALMFVKEHQSGMRGECLILPFSPLHSRLECPARRYKAFVKLTSLFDEHENSSKENPNQEPRCMNQLNIEYNCI
jgi:hypothetical protein